MKFKKTSKPIRQSKFKAPFHLALALDDLRSRLTVAWFIDGYVYATTGEILVKQSLINFHGLTEKEAEMLNGKCLSAYKLKIMWDAMEIVFEPDQIKVVTKQGVKLRFDYDEQPDRPYSFDEVLNIKRDEDFVGIPAIGMNPHNLIKLHKAMGANYFLHLHFCAQRKAILAVDGNNDRGNLGLIMPVMMDEYSYNPFNG